MPGSPVRGVGKHGMTTWVRIKNGGSVREWYQFSDERLVTSLSERNISAPEGVQVSRYMKTRVGITRIKSESTA